MTQLTIPYAPRYPGIHETLESHRFCVLVAHRRFGKTVLSVNHLIKMALTGELPRSSYAYVCPFRNQAKTVAWAYLKHYTAVIPGREVNESELAIELPGRGGRSRIRIFGADNPDALRGAYLDGVVLDEVAQMKPEVWGEVIQPMLADRKGWALFIGTPKGINLFSELYARACDAQAHGNPDWAAMSFPVTATNALASEEVERLRTELSDNAYRQEMLCDFAASSDDTLISLSLVDAAMAREANPELSEAWPVIGGVDVARFGADATVFFPRRGMLGMKPVVLRNHDNVEIAHRLMAFIAERRPQYVCIDQGQGTGVIDLVRKLCQSHATNIIEVPFGSRPLHEERFVNRRAEMWTAIRDWLRSGGSLPHDPGLLGELTAPAYDYDAKGRIRLEAKDEIRKRLNRSTDLADALALTFAVKPGPIGEAMPGLDRYGRRAAARARAWLGGEKEEWSIFNDRPDDDDSFY